MKFVELRLWSSNGATATLLPHYGTLSVSDIFCDAGFGSFTYPLDDFEDGQGRSFSGAASLNLGINSEIGVFTEAGEVLRFYIETQSTPYVVDGLRVVSLQGRSVLGYFEDAIVYPSAWPSTIPAGHAFVDSTPGNIMRTLIARWKGRYGGGLRIDETSFTGPLTSNGVAWTKIITNNYTNGYTYLQVLQDLFAQGMCEFDMVGRQLRLYNAGFISGVHRTILLSQRGRNMLEASGDKDTKDVGTVVLVEGDNYVALSLPDTGAIDGFRRREKYVTAGGIQDSGTLNLIGTSTLAVSKLVPEQVSIGVTANDQRVDPSTGKIVVYGDPQPWIDYNPGEWVRVDRSGTIEELQVQQIALDVDVNRKITVGVTVGTLIDDAELRLQRKIDAITNGNSGSYGPTPNPNPDDRIAPASPSTVNVSSSGYVTLTGTPYSQVTISWPAVVANSDGTFCDDLDHYEVQEKVGSNDWGVTGQIPAGTVVTYDSQLPPGQHFLARVRAVDSVGNASPYTTSADTVLALVTTPPPTPSLPQVTNSVGSLYVTWDGHDSTGGVMATPAYRFVEVHMSTSSPTFTLSAATLQGTLSGPNVVRVQPITYGVTYYIRFRTVDYVANLSPPTAAVSFIPGAIQTGDLGNSAVTAAILAANAVTTTKIADGSISTPKIIAGAITTATILAGAITAGTIAAGAITTDKLVAGSITADKLAASIVLASQIIAGSAIGARVQLDTTGVNAFNSDGDNTVSIGSDGAATFTGSSVSAAEIDAPVIVINSPDSGGLFLYGSSNAALNQNSQFLNSTNFWSATATSITYSSIHLYNGHNTMRASRTDGAATVQSENIPITAGTQYQCSALMLATSATPIYASIRWVNGSGTEIGHTNSPGTSQSFVTGNWTQVNVSGVAPTGATTAIIRLGFSVTDTTAAFYTAKAALINANVFSSLAAVAGTDAMGNTYPAGLRTSAAVVGTLAAGNIHYGAYSGATNTNGQVVITHGLGADPGSTGGIQITMTATARALYKPVIATHSASTFTVGFINTSDGTTITTNLQPCNFYWHAEI